jgi:hypothetical protein
MSSQCFSAEKEVLSLHTKVDLVVTLGGDGTVLWVCSFSLMYITLRLIVDSFCNHAWWSYHRPSSFAGSINVQRTSSPNCTVFFGVSWLYDTILYPSCQLMKFFC